MTIYCFIEGVSLFTSYLFLPFFNKGDYFEKPAGITDDYRCEMPLYKDFLKQSIALNAVQFKTKNDQNTSTELIKA